MWGLFVEDGGKDKRPKLLLASSPSLRYWTRLPCPNPTVFASVG